MDDKCEFVLCAYSEEDGQFHLGGGAGMQGLS